MSGVRVRRCERADLQARRHRFRPHAWVLHLWRYRIDIWATAKPPWSTRPKGQHASGA